jgi:hypothetical protein
MLRSLLCAVFGCQFCTPSEGVKFFSGIDFLYPEEAEMDTYIYKARGNLYRIAVTGSSPEVQYISR